MMTDFPVDLCLRLWREDLKVVLHGGRFEKPARKHLYAGAQTQFVARVCFRLVERHLLTRKEISYVWGFTTSRLFQLIDIAHELKYGTSGKEA